MKWVWGGGGEKLRGDENISTSLARYCVGSKNRGDSLYCINRSVFPLISRSYGLEWIVK